MDPRVLDVERDVHGPFPPEVHHQFFGVLEETHQVAVESVVLSQLLED